jgi:quercetin dioxygenase-like cupin family protein
MEETTMSNPESSQPGAVFAVAAVEADMRQEDAYRRDGHTARTVVREEDLRVVLIVMKAGARLAEHQASDTAVIHALSGHVRLRLTGTITDLPSGRLLVLERGLRHDVEAMVDSAFLLTLGWHAKQLASS